MTCIEEDRMPDEDDFDDGYNPGIPMSDFTKGGLPGNPCVTSPSEMDAVLARMADPEVRAHFARLLKELGH